jgi:acyl carrier protein
MQCEEIKEVRSEVRDYVISSFYVPSPETLADSASLLKTGIIDETGMLEMVAFLESTFGIRIEEEDIIPENLDSIARVAAFVCRRKADDAEEQPLPDPIEIADAVELDHEASQSLTT